MELLKHILTCQANLNATTSADQGLLVPLHIATDGAPGMVKLLIQVGQVSVTSAHVYFRGVQILRLRMPMGIHLYIKQVRS